MIQPPAFLCPRENVFYMNVSCHKGSHTMTLNSEASSEQVGDQAPQVDHQQPKSTSEKYLAALWSEIIGLERVLLPHRFLEVGGNSLTLNIILSRIEAEKGASLDAQLFFDDEKSSLFELARELDVKLGGTPARLQ